MISKVCVNVSCGKVDVIVLYWTVVPGGSDSVIEMICVCVSRGRVDTIAL